MLLLAVDPGVVSGWAVFDLQPNNQPNLIDYGQMRIEFKRNSEWSEFWGKWQSYTHASIVCEGQYIQQGATKKVYGQQRSALKTSSIAGQWEGVARVYGWHVFDRVHPSTWKAALFGTSKADKQIALTYVSNVWHVSLPKTKHHCAESICIGSYQAKNVLMGRVVNNKKR